MLRRPRFRLSRHVTERVMNKQLDILVRKDPDIGVWVSQCLQYDIAAQGASIKDSLVAFTHALVSEVVYGIEVRKLVDDPLSELPRPPEEIKRLFDGAEAKVMRAAVPKMPHVPPAVHAAMPELHELRVA